MIDLETMDVGPDAAIVSIGLCQFFTETQEIKNLFYQTVDLHTQEGRSFSLDTLEWWLTKNADNSRILFAEDSISLHNMLKDLRKHLYEIHFQEIWANSPSFDLSILKHAFDQHGLKCPWQYYQERDFRTIKGLYKGDLSHITNKNAHDALDDAVYQADVINFIYKEMNL